MSQALLNMAFTSRVELAPWNEKHSFVQKIESENRDQQLLSITLCELILLIGGEWLDYNST